MKNASTKRAPRRAAAKVPPATTAGRPSVTIVGIGASAGGLEALEELFGNIPKDSGAAFVVVQHLDPTHKGMLAEILQRSSSIPVAQITDGTRVEPDHVYVIPPNADLSVFHGVLHLAAPVIARSVRLPIDHFFRSLAHDQEERAVGVILSGMGSDGTLGLRAIRERAGATFVQLPASAKFDGMPRSAIEADVADVVAPAAELPARILAFRTHARKAESEPPPPEGKPNGLAKVMIVLRASTGHDFSLYKSSTLHRRVHRRMSLHQIDSLDRYVRFLRENPSETELLFKELLIGVTSFFRDPAMWAHLKSIALPALLAARPKNAALRAWVPGCSTGEEAYSLAMVFREALDDLGASATLQIFATDLDGDAIDRARQGVYPTSIAADVSPERLRRFFIEDARGYRVSGSIRDMVVFATHNVIQEPPFTKLDLLTCRNLLIYLTPEVQQKLIPLFHYCLKPGGILFLGSAETVGAFGHLFSSLEASSRLYRRTEVGAASPSTFPPAYGASLHRAAASEVAEPAPPRAPNLQSLAEQMLLKRFAPTAVLTTTKGDVLYVSGRGGKYLELPAGKANWNVLAMARRNLRDALARAFHSAVRTEKVVRVAGLSAGTKRAGHLVDVIVAPVREPEALRGMVMVVFVERDSHDEQPVMRLPREAPSVTRLATELTAAREELRTAREEMQTSQEELKSTNEELQSTNEELQSTNEELTTSKEEMQSMNEELQTLNHELQAKVDDLSRTSNDMKNLLDSTEIATLFLDDSMKVRRFTPQVTALFKLIPGDIGRPLPDLATGLDYPALYEDAREVLRSLVFRERAVRSRDGRWFRVRIMPYRTWDNRIDGLVLTFMDVTELERLRASTPRVQPRRPEGGHDREE